MVAADPADVWRAFTEPALTESWLGDFRMTSRWRVGDPFVIEGRQLNGHDHTTAGTVLAAEPPTLLRFDHWSSLWRVPDLPDNRAVMTVHIEPDGDRTRVTLIHALPVVEAIVPHARFFWSVALVQLQKLLAAGRP